MLDTLPELVQFSNSQLNIIKKIALDSDRIFNCIISERYFLTNLKAVSMDVQEFHSVSNSLSPRIFKNSVF